jgi:hypothetical protein
LKITNSATFSRDLKFLFKYLTPLNGKFARIRPNFLGFYGHVNQYYMIEHGTSLSFYPHSANDFVLSSLRQKARNACWRFAKVSVQTLIELARDVFLDEAN